eukprot:1405225-Pyramimonas_sp.AAC.1
MLLSFRSFGAASKDPHNGGVRCSAGAGSGNKAHNRVCLHMGVLCLLLDVRAVRDLPAGGAHPGTHGCPLWTPHNPFMAPSGPLQTPYCMRWCRTSPPGNPIQIPSGTPSAAP